MKILWLAATFCAATASTPSDIWCKDEQGNNVEWSIIYKVPNTISTKFPATTRREHQGSEYGYMDSQMIANKQTNFSIGAGSIFTEALNPLANTLAPIFKWDKTKADEKLVYIGYNDQPPSQNLEAASSGHTKGVLIFDSQTGIWLVHSVPRFPQKLFSGNYSFPENGHVNGQTLLCMTFSTRSLAVIDIFESNAPADVLEKIPDLKLLLKHEFPHKEIPVLKSVLSGVRGTPFVAFAKSANLDDDVYSAAIAPAMNSDLFVSSWQNGEGGKLDPECKMKFKVLDVKSVSFRFGDHELAWLNKHDHSKWAVSQNNSTSLCIGSINRMHSQFKRGGETVCFAEQEAGQLFLNAITDHAKCGSGADLQ